MRFQNSKKIDITHTIPLKIPSGITQVNIYFSIPSEHLNQSNILIKEISPPPLEYLNIEDNKVAYFECKSSIRIYIRCHYVISELKLEKPTSVTELSTKEYKRFTCSQQLIQINNEIKNLAQNIVKDEKEPIKRAKLLFTWIIENIKYKKPSDNFGNLIALSTKHVKTSATRMEWRKR